MSASQLRAMMAETGVADEDAAELVTVLAPLEELADRAPLPSAELLALLGDGGEVTAYDAPSLVASPPAHRARAAVIGAVVLAISGVGATGLSAAANTLPAPWQHGVSDFARHHLPFDFPQPPARSLPREPAVPGAPQASGPTGRGPGEPSRGAEGEVRTGAQDVAEEAAPVAPASADADPARGPRTQRPARDRDERPSRPRQAVQVAEPAAPAPAPTRGPAEERPEKRPDDVEHRGGGQDDERDPDDREVRWTWQLSAAPPRPAAGPSFAPGGDTVDPPRVEQVRPGRADQGKPGASRDDEKGGQQDQPRDSEKRGDDDHRGDHDGGGRADKGDPARS